MVEMEHTTSKNSIIESLGSPTSFISQIKPNNEKKGYSDVGHFHFYRLLTSHVNGKWVETGSKPRLK